MNLDKEIKKILKDRGLTKDNRKQMFKEIKELIEKARSCKIITIKTIPIVNAIAGQDLRGVK